MPMSSPSAPLAPVVLEPVFSHRVWGVNDLSPWYSGNPGVEWPIGEAWLTSVDCRAASGETLGELAKAHPSELAAPAGQFPLLVKFLFPREKLSVQVHPDDAQAQALGEANGKTECWYVLSAEPGAMLAVGLRGNMTPEAIKEAIHAGTLEEHLNYVPVKAGDMVFVDAGTVHAIGPGMVVLETQQYSDVTYRLYDYGRPRELHVDAGLAVTRPQTKAGLVEPVAMEGFTRLIASEYFIVDRFSLTAGSSAALKGRGTMQILVALKDGCSASADGATVPLPAGRAVILPAGSGEWILRAEGDAEVIRIERP